MQVKVVIAILLEGKLPGTWSPADNRYTVAVRYSSKLISSPIRSGDENFGKKRTIKGLLMNVYGETYLFLS